MNALLRHRRAAVMAAVLVMGAGAVVAVHGLRWRAEVVLMKARGGVPDMSWAELLRMLPPGRGYLEPLLQTGNPFVSVENPRVTKADRDAGERVYRSRCIACHGEGAESRGAPDLVHASLGRATSPWGFYEAIKRGVRGTAMAPQPLADRERWQVVAYVQARRLQASRPAATAVPALPAIAVSAGLLRSAAGDSGEWLTYSGTYAGQRFSRLAQIRAHNVGGLRPVWVFQFPRSGPVNEASPIVAGNALYVTSGPNHVWALDARTGRPAWHYERDLPDRLSLCCGQVNRGVAILDSTIFVGTLDAHLVALDARTGTVRWDTRVGDPAEGHSITAAPLALGDRVVTGVAGGEYGAPGYVDAYAAATGRRLWRFRTVPRAGELGNETWAGDSWKTGAGPTWLTGSYDPALNLVFWGVGNPGPNYAGPTRRGSNLYTNSVVALDAETGRLRWHYQFTPHDEHDWDAAQIPVLVDGRYDGRPRHLLLWANRNAFYYVLDRETGRFLRAAPFEEQTWTSGIDTSGQPIPTGRASPSPAGTFAYPSVVGATNWWSPSYSPATGLVYVPTLHLGGTFFLDAAMLRGDVFTGGAATLAYDRPHWSAIKAIEAATGAVRWEYHPAEADAIPLGGLLATAGGLVFGGAGTTFYALDAVTGKKLWDFNAGSKITAAPISFLADGQQRIAIVAGGALLVFGL